MILFKILACTPMERRQVCASNIVSKAKKQLKAKMGEEKPSSLPKEKANAATAELWAEGMPPVLKSHIKLNFFSRTSPIKTFKL